MARSVETGTILNGKGVSKTCSSGAEQNVVRRIAETAEIAQVFGGGRMGFRPEEKGIKTESEQKILPDVLDGIPT